MKRRMDELLIPIESTNTSQLVVPAAEQLNSYKQQGGGSAYRNVLPNSAVDLAVSHSRSWAFWPLLRFVKETYIWLVWIPVVLLVLGIGMNFLAVTMNHGIMPVVLPPSGTIADRDKLHVAASANSRVLFLCDWIQLHTTKNVASPGDFLITAGDFLKWPLVWMWIGFSWRHLTRRKRIGSYANAQLTC